MKKIFAIVLGLALIAGNSFSVLAQDEEGTSTETEETVEAEDVAGDSMANAEETTDTTTTITEDGEGEAEAEEAEEEPKGKAVLKKKFIEGGALFMTFPLICLILGLAISVERIITLVLSKSNHKKLLRDVESAITSGGVDKALGVCRETRGPVASIFYQGLLRSKQGIKQVEKSLMDYGGVQAGLLEKGLVWLSLFIALAPMLGFMGTVIGMIDAFDDIQNAGEISATIVAGGIKIALLTTVAGLIVAVILQLFYNLILSMVDGLTNQMEDASIDLVDMLLKHEAVDDK
jgi:biopolymer transport protein ExbB